MKYLILLTLSLVALLGHAAPLTYRWKVETSRPANATVEVYQGETLTLEATLMTYSRTFVPAQDAVARFFWRDAEARGNYWSEPATLTGNKLTFVWTPNFDVGAKRYDFFLSVESATEGTAYRALGTLVMRESPGFSPAHLKAPDVLADIVNQTTDKVLAQTDAKYAAKTHTHSDLATTAALAEAKSEALSAADTALSEAREAAAVGTAAQTAIATLQTTKQDTLTAGASIDISENVISVYGDEPTYQTAGPAAAGDRGEGMGYQGTINTILAGNEGSIALREISIMRRTNNATWWQKTLYCRVLRQVNNTWVTALQSANAVRMDSAAVDAWLGPWQMEPTAPEHASFPAGEVVRIVWVEDPTVAANTNTLIGCRTTGTYAGFIGSDNATTYAFAPCFKLTYRTGFITRGQMNDAIEAIDTTWEGISGKPSTFTPSAHTHTTDQITDFSTEIGKVETWVKAHAPDANGNITHTNLNSRANTLSDTAYVNEGGAATRAIAAVTAEGTTKAQVQQVLDSTSSAHLSVNTMTSGAQATVKARAIGSSDNFAALAASDSGAKLLLSDATGSLTLTPTTQWPWSKLSGIPTTFTPSTHTHDQYLTSYTETDPTIAAWAKATTKPSYTYSEITDTPTTWPWASITDKPSTFTPSDHNHDSRYLRASNNRISSEVYFDGGFRADSFKTIYGTPLITTVASQGFAITGIYTISAYRKEAPFYKYDINKPNEEFIDVKNLKEDSVSLADKYAAKSHTHSDLATTAALAAAKSEALSAADTALTEAREAAAVGAAAQTAIATLQTDLQSANQQISQSAADITALEATAATHAPLSSVTATVDTVTYIWEWDSEEGTFALVPSSN